MKFDIRCIHMTHEMFSDKYANTITTSLVHVNDCKCEGTLSSIENTHKLQVEIRKFIEAIRFL